ncbi:MAG: molybdopterin-guanine dinucleotide biosynthesis protein B, partial [Eggerthellaceae bacterium]|nr:molybdopterin-guanine dinucleotide biosynthesis protein B [Eggerthellaceae bacterium]
MIDIPSPAVAVVGRHNSGKTTLVVKLIAALTEHGHALGSVTHHHKEGFQIDLPGKDTYRHREAGATETVIASPGQFACIKTISGEQECADIVAKMPGHDLVIVEGYRKSGLPTIEIMRADNAADAKVAEAFAEGARVGASLGTDFIQASRGDRAFEADPDLLAKMPTANTIAVVTDIPAAIEASQVYGIPAFDPDDV